jgi:multidrug efflux system membrane fusion protein
VKRSQRIGIIAASVVVAGILAAFYYRHAERYPSTDDAYVDADVVGIVAQVSGPIVNLPIVDNQAVRAGDLLFEIDPRPFAIAVEKARAGLLQDARCGEKVKRGVVAREGRSFAPPRNRTLGNAPPSATLQVEGGQRLRTFADLGEGQ